MLMIQGPEVLQESVTIPPEIYQQCQAGNFPTEGNAGGVKDSVTNFGTLPASPPLLRTGWTPVMIGTFVACILAALLGITSLCIFGLQTGADEDEDEEEQEDYEDHHIE